VAEYFRKGNSDSRMRVDAYEAVFSALSHAARRRVLLTIYLSGGAMAAGDIAAVFKHAWQTTTRHLQVLEAAGLLTHERHGRMRIYRLQTKRLELVADWLAHFSKRRKYEEGQSWQRKKDSKGKTRGK